MTTVTANELILINKITTQTETTIDLDDTAVVWYIDAGTSSTAIVLPASSNVGLTYIIKRVDTNFTTTTIIIPQSGDNIQGLSLLPMQSSDIFTIQLQNIDGGVRTWQIIGYAAQ